MARHLADPLGLVSGSTLTLNIDAQGTGLFKFDTIDK